MEAFSTPVREFMIEPIRTVSELERAVEAEQKMAAWGVSALAVVDSRGAMVGVLSRTDLLKAGRPRSKSRSRRQALMLPEVPVRELMTASVEIVTPETPMSSAARRMVREHIHRLYVSEDRHATGVVSTKEMMRAVAEARVAQPLSA